MFRSLSAIAFARKDAQRAAKLQHFVDLAHKHRNDPELAAEYLRIAKEYERTPKAQQRIDAHRMGRAAERKLAEARALGFRG